MHFDECSPCLEKYGLEQAVKKLVKRCCGQDDVPSDLRSKVMGRIELIRSGQAVPELSVREQAEHDRPSGSRLTPRRPIRHERTAGRRPSVDARPRPRGPDKATRHPKG